MQDRNFLLLKLLGCWLASCFVCNAASAASLASAIEALPQATGQTKSMPPMPNAKLRVFAFLGSDCPLAKLYAPRLAALADTFRDREVEFVGINSNPQDSLEDVVRFVDSASLPLRVLKDHDQVVLGLLEPRRTPEVIAIDSKGREVYRGRIDDQYQPGVVRAAATRDDLRVAIEEFLDGRSISIPRTEGAGCLIARTREPKQAPTVTYCNQVVRILQRHCVECHRPGEIGPFSLLEFHEVQGWSEMIVETVENRRMPPWHANPDHGDFVNARHFSDEDRKTLRTWVDEGAPFGNVNDVPVEGGSRKISSEELPVEFEIAMRAEPYAVPATGEVEYQYFVVDPGFAEDRWVRSAELVPSNRSVVHHGIVFVRPPDGTAMRGIGTLAAYVPGQISMATPAHRAKRIPAGSKLVFQMHYTPNGTLQQDQSRLRLAFADEAKVTEEHLSVLSLNQELEIPPGQSDVTIDGPSPSLARGR